MAFSSRLSKHLEMYVQYRAIGNRWNSGYEGHLKSFDRLCKKQFPEDTQLKQEMIDLWCKRHDNEKPSSCRKRIYPLYGFVNFWNERNSDNLVFPEIPSKEARTYRPHYFTEDELKRFFKECDELELPFNASLIHKARLLVIPAFFRLLYATGMRPYEARFLTVKAVDLEKGLIEINVSKGGHQRNIAIGDDLREYLKRYHDQMDLLFPSRNYFFHSPKTGETYSKEWVTYTFRNIWKKANPGVNAIAYNFRHHFIITNINKLVETGLEFHDKLLYLSRYVGHATVEETKYYYSLTPQISSIIHEVAEEADDLIIPEVIFDEETE